MLLAARHPHSIHLTCARPPSPPHQARMRNALGSMHCAAWLLGPCRGISAQITCHIPRTSEKLRVLGVLGAHRRAVADAAQLRARALDELARAAPVVHCAMRAPAQH